jgi:hypothetical protein
MKTLNNSSFLFRHNILIIFCTFLFLLNMCLYNIFYYHLVSFFFRLICFVIDIYFTCLVVSFFFLHMYNINPKKVITIFYDLYLKYETILVEM